MLVSLGSHNPSAFFIGDLQPQCLFHWGVTTPVLFSLESYNPSACFTGESQPQCFFHWGVTTPVLFSLGSPNPSAFFTGELQPDGVIFTTAPTVDSSVNAALDCPILLIVSVAQGNPNSLVPLPGACDT